MNNSNDDSQENMQDPSGETPDPVSSSDGSTSNSGQSASVPAGNNNSSSKSVSGLWEVEQTQHPKLISKRNEATHKRKRFIDIFPLDEDGSSPQRRVVDILSPKLDELEELQNLLKSKCYADDSFEDHRCKLVSKLVGFIKDNSCFLSTTSIDYVIPIESREGDLKHVQFYSFLEASISFVLRITDYKQRSRLISILNTIQTMEMFLEVYSTINEPNHVLNDTTVVTLLQEMLTKNHEYKYAAFRNIYSMLASQHVELEPGNPLLEKILKLFFDSAMDQHYVCGKQDHHSLSFIFSKQRHLLKIINQDVDPECYYFKTLIMNEVIDGLKSSSPYHRQQFCGEFLKYWMESLQKEDIPLSMVHFLLHSLIHFIKYSTHGQPTHTLPSILSQCIVFELSYCDVNEDASGMKFSDLMRRFFDLESDVPPPRCPELPEVAKPPTSSPDAGAGADGAPSVPPDVPPDGGSIPTATHADFSNSKNCHLGKCVFEVVLLVLKSFSLKLKECESHSYDCFDGQADVLKELETFLDLMGWSHATYELVFNTNEDDWKNEIHSEFLRETEVAYLNETLLGRRDSIQATLNHEQLSELPQMAPLHPWNRNFLVKFRSKFLSMNDVSSRVSPSSSLSSANGVPSSVGSSWTDIFIALFMHMNELGKSEGSKNMYRLVEPSINSMSDGFCELGRFLNNTSFRSMHANEFYHRVLANSKQAVQFHSKKEKSVDDLMKLICLQVERLCQVMVDLSRADSCEHIDFGKIKDEDAIMNYSLASELERKNYEYFKEMVSSQDGFVDRVSMLGRFILLFKDILDPELNKDFIESLEQGDILRLKQEIYPEVPRDELQTISAEETYACFVQSIIKEYAHSQNEGKIDFIYDIIRRKLAKIRFKREDMWKGFLELNTSDEDVVVGESQSIFGKTFDDFNTFANEMLNMFEGKYPALNAASRSDNDTDCDNNTPNAIEEFENNQLLALFLYMQYRRESTRSDSKPLLLKIGTGQGKSLVLTALAILHLLENPDSKVVIFTAFDHLALRDEELMRSMCANFVLPSKGKRPIRSISLRSSEDVKKFTLGIDIVFVDSNTLSSLVRSEVFSKKPNQDFINFAFSDWKENMVLLDEVDILMCKQEQLLVHSVYETFCGEEADGHQEHNNSTNAIKSKLLGGKFKDVTDIFEFSEYVQRELNNETKGDEKATIDQSEFKTTSVHPLGYQLKNNELMFPIGYFCKCKLQEVSKKNILGVSGSFDTKSFVDTCGPLFNLDVCASAESRNFTLFEIPPFYDARGERFSHMTMVTKYADDAQLPFYAEKVENNELPKGSERANFPACQSRSIWFEKIAEEIDHAKRNGKPVLVFASHDTSAALGSNMGNDEVDDKLSDFAYLEKYLRTKGILDEAFGGDTSILDFQDSDIQRIVQSNDRVSLATKVVGRGADLRGRSAHVIVASPENYEEIVQQIGRSGRMGKPGTFSFIFHMRSRIPSFPAIETPEALKNRQALQKLAAQFYLKRAPTCTRETYQLFLWFQHIFLILSSDISPLVLESAKTFFHESIMNGT